MEFRTVVIRSKCKLSYKDGYLIVRGDEVKTIHISEIHSLVIETTMATVTAYLVCELMKNKANVVFCDERRNPVGELHPCYGSNDTARRVQEQAEWPSARKNTLWQSIVRQKIRNQGRLLKKADPEAAKKIIGYIEEVQPADMTNREGMAAKVYFNRIFGSGFAREIKSDRNAALNYGYAIILSTFNKEIVARGFCTQLGVHHHNTFNQFNLSCDLMEPFRCLVDDVVLQQGDAVFDHEYKEKLLDVLNRTVKYNRQNMAVSTAITRYVRYATDYLSGKTEWEECMGFHYEDTANETDCDV